MENLEIPKHVVISSFATRWRQIPLFSFLELLSFTQVKKLNPFTFPEHCRSRYELAGERKFRFYLASSSQNSPLYCHLYQQPHSSPCSRNMGSTIIFPPFFFQMYLQFLPISKFFLFVFNVKQADVLLSSSSFIEIILN